MPYCHGYFCFCGTAADKCLPHLSQAHLSPLPPPPPNGNLSKGLLLLNLWNPRLSHNTVTAVWWRFQVEGKSGKTTVARQSCSQRGFPSICGVTNDWWRWSRDTGSRSESECGGKVSPRRSHSKHPVRHPCIGLTGRDSFNRMVIDNILHRGVKHNGDQTWRKSVKSATETTLAWTPNQSMRPVRTGRGSEAVQDTAERCEPCCHSF